MLIICTGLFGCYLMIFGAIAEHKNLKNNHTETSLLEKQHDYQLNFERLELIRYDKRYIKFFHVRTFKHNRTCPVVNITLMFNMDMGYNMELIIQAYKFASNEYRPFPIRFEVNFCQAIAKNAAGMADLFQSDTCSVCPLVKERNYGSLDWSPNPAMFPPFIPNGQYMIEITGFYDYVELYVQRGYGTVFRPISIPD